MAKAANRSGSVRYRAGRWTARVSLGAPLGRRELLLPTCSTEEQACARLAVLTDLVEQLRAAGQIASGLPLLERAAVRDGKALEDVLRVAAQLCRGELRPRTTGAITFQEYATRWTSGELANEFPDHVKRKRTSADDAGRLELHVYPVIGHVAIQDVTLDHALAVLRQLSMDLAPATRRHVAQLMVRVLSLAAFPSRLIPVSPLPRGFLPQKSGEKALAYLYPDEDARLLACPDVPTGYRLWYGFLAREGLRVSEAGSLTWAEVDLEHGAITLDKNKTDDPRAWALDPGVVRALSAWRSMRGASPADRVFLNTQGRPMGRRNAERFRAHLQKAGVERAELYQATAARQQIRAHDLRATFVTTHLANGRTETWIADRTGHRSSAMIAKYRRAARKVAELAMGGLSPLDLAIPELGGGASSGGASAEGNDGQAGASPQRSPAPSTGTPAGAVGAALGLTERAARGASLAPPKSSMIPSRCTRGESNPHALRRRNLNPVRMPIPPLVRGPGLSHPPRAPSREKTAATP